MATPTALAPPAAALDTRAIGARLATHLRAPGAQVVDCRVVRYRHRPGARCVVQYGVAVREASGARVEARVVGQWHTGDRGAAARARTLARRVDHGHGPWSSPFPPVFFDAATDMLATTYPFDRRLPALAAVASGASPDVVAPMRAHLRLAADTPLTVDVACVRYREQLNAVLQYDVRAADTGSADRRGRFFVKVYGDDGGARMLAVHRALTQATAGRAPVGVAPAVAYVGALGALVTAQAEGCPLDRVPLDRAGLEATLQSVAAGLAAFGTLRLAAELPLATAATGATDRSVAALAPVLPDQTASLASLARATAALADEPATGLVHGDLKLEHVFVHGGHVQLIDLDSCHRGLAAWDLALLTERWWASRDASPAGRPLADWGAHVLAMGYFARVGRPAVPLPLLRAAASLDVAAGLVKRREADWRARASRLVSRAVGHLQAGRS